MVKTGSIKPWIWILRAVGIVISSLCSCRRWGRQRLNRGIEQETPHGLVELPGESHCSHAKPMYRNIQTNIEVLIKNIPCVRWLRCIGALCDFQSVLSEGMTRVFHGFLHLQAFVWISREHQHDSPTDLISDIDHTLSTSWCCDRNAV